MEGRSELALPQLKGVQPQVGVVVATVARDLIPDEIRLFEGFIRRGKLYLGHDQTLVIAIELIDLEGMPPTADQITRLVDDTRLAKAKQMLSLIERNLFLKLITAQPAVK